MRFSYFITLIFIFLAVGAPALAQETGFHLEGESPVSHRGRLWGDGQDLMAMTGSPTNSTVLITRGGHRVELPGPVQAGPVHGIGHGSTATIVVGGDDEVGILREGRWQIFRGTAEQPFGLVTAVAVAPDGTAYVSGHDRGLHRLRGDEWTTWEFPRRCRGARSIDVLEDGRLLMLGDDYKIYQLGSDRFIRPSFLDNLEGSLGTFGSNFMWQSRHSDRLWLQTSSRMLAVDVDRGVYDLYQVPSQVSVVRGGTLDTMDMIVLVHWNDHRVHALRREASAGRRPRLPLEFDYEWIIAHLPSNPRDLYLDPVENMLYVLGDRRLWSIDLPLRPEEGSMPHRADPDQEGTDAELDGIVQESQIASSTRFVESDERYERPLRPPSSPRFSRAQPAFNFLAGVGVGIYPGRQHVTRAEIDITARYEANGYRRIDSGRDTTSVIGPQLGLTVVAPPGGTNLFVTLGLACAAVFANSDISLGFVALFLNGRNDDDAAAGGRLGALLDFRYGELEVSYQVTTPGVHSIRAVLSFNFAATFDTFVLGALY